VVTAVAFQPETTDAFSAGLVATAAFGVPANSGGSQHHSDTEAGQQPPAVMKADSHRIDESRK